MESAYLNLISFLLQKDKRLVLEPIVKQIKFDVPFDLIIDEMFMSKVDLTKDDLLSFVKGKLNASQFNYLKGMSNSVSTAVGYRSIQYLQSVTQLGQVADVLKSRLRPEKNCRRYMVLPTLVLLLHKL